MEHLERASQGFPKVGTLAHLRHVNRTYRKFGAISWSSPSTCIALRPIPRLLRPVSLTRQYIAVDFKRGIGGSMNVRGMSTHTSALNDQAIPTARCISWSAQAAAMTAVAVVWSTALARAINLAVSGLIGSAVSGGSAAAPSASPVSSGRAGCRPGAQSSNVLQSCVARI